jgi:ATP-binding cassette subfamily B protein
VKAKLDEFVSQLVYVPRAFQLIWAAAPRWTLAWLALLLIQGVLPTINVYLTRKIVNELAAAWGGSIAWQNIEPTVVAGLLIVSVAVFGQITQNVLNWVRMGQSEIVRDHLSALVHAKTVAADLAYFETPDYHDRMHQASNDLKNRPLALLESSGTLLQSSITLLSMAALLIPYGLWVPLALVISAAPTFIVLMRVERTLHAWWDRTTSERRWVQYYDTMLMHEAAAAEVRLFNLGPYLQSAYQALRSGLRSDLLRMTRRQSVARFGATVFAAVMFGLAMAWMVVQAFLGLVTPGDIAMFYQATSKSQNLLRNALNNAGEIFNNTLYLENLFAFLDLESQLRDPSFPSRSPDRLTEGIRFHKVSFSYPGADRPVFEEFNFTIPANKIVAIVGENGVGKTTLVKLLCRLYDPQSGRIEFDGIDIRDFRVNEVRRMISGMFQFPVHYFSDVTQNIAMGDLMRARSDGEVIDAARQAGAHDFIMDLPKGYATLLGKWFPEGVELSGGEWQKLALARAFYRQAPIIVLDEPTSFMDSWSEIDWFERFRTLANRRTAILITHRFTIARKADLIYVMERGGILECGTHEDLLALSGRYAKSWVAQTQERVHVAAI